MAPGIVHKRVVDRMTKGEATDWNDNHEITGDIDMGQNQLLNNVIENRTSFTPGPVLGQMIFRTDYPNGFIWNGTAWKSMTPAQLIVVASDGSGDYLTIQEGLDALPATGGVVHVKTGTYTITATITFPNDSITLQGDGVGTKILSTTQDLSFIEVDGNTRIRIRDLYLYGDGIAKNQVGIEYLISDSGSMENVLVENFGGYGILMDTSEANLVKNCWVRDCWNVGIAMLDCDKNFFDNNRVLDIYEDDVAWGIWVNDSNKNIFSDNNVERSEGHGVYFTTSTYNNFEGNMVSNNSHGNVNVSGGIALADTSTHNTITGNKSFDDKGVHTQKWGIIEGAGVDNYNIITNNVCTDNITAEIVKTGANSIEANNITLP